MGNIAQGCGSEANMVRGEAECNIALRQLPQQYMEHHFQHYIFQGKICTLCSQRVKITLHYSILSSHIY